ncbi:unnamed protein product [Camellia sinensis]
MNGTGLLGGTINHFITCYDPPKVLVCTHLTEIFNDSCIQESDNIKYYTMSVLRPDDGTNIEDIVFLYRLVPGHALLSYGLHCALLAGVPEEVIKRAASLLNAIGNNNHVDRLCNDKISAQDRQYKDTIDKIFMLVHIHRHCKLLRTVKNGVDKEVSCCFSGMVEIPEDMITSVGAVLGNGHAWNLGSQVPQPTTS